MSCCLRAASVGCARQPFLFKGKLQDISGAGTCSERLFQSQAWADVQRRYEGSLMKGGLKYSWLQSGGEVREKKTKCTPNPPKKIANGP